MEYEQVPGRLFVESPCRDPDLDLLFQPFLGRSSDTQPTTTAQHARWLLDILTSSPQYSSRLTGNLHLHSAGFILGELNALMFKTDNSDFLMHFCILLSRPLRSILLLSCLCPLHLSPKLFTLQVSSANAVSSLVRSWACWRFACSSTSVSGPDAVVFTGSEALNTGRTLDRPILPGYTSLMCRGQVCVGIFSNKTKSGKPPDFIVFLTRHPQEHCTSLQCQFTSLQIYGIF